MRYVLVLKGHAGFRYFMMLSKVAGKRFLVFIISPWLGALGIRKGTRDERQGVGAAEVSKLGTEPAELEWEELSSRAVVERSGYDRQRALL